MKFKRIISIFLVAVSIFANVAVAAELPKKLTLEVSGWEVLERDGIVYLEILLQSGENANVIYLEKANNWKAEVELNPREYKLTILNVSPSKYLISNDYSVTISDKDVVSKIKIKNFPDETSEVKEKPQEIENKKPIKKKSKEQQYQTTGQTLKNRSIKIAMTAILCTLAAAIILIILWLISKIID